MSEPARKLITTGLFTWVWSTIFCYLFIGAWAAIASRVPVRDAATTSFYAAQKFNSIRKCVWSDLEENGVVSYLLPLLVSAGIMHFARRSVKPPADGG